MNYQTGCWLAAVLALSSCGEGSEGGFCSGSFAGGRLVTNTASCPGCQVNNAASAIDGNGNSAADVIFNSDSVSPNGGEVSLLASGRNFPAGSIVGAFMQFPRPEGRGYTNVSATFVTYRGGVQQEMIFGSSTTVGTIDGAGSKVFYGGQANLAFDSLEAIASLGNVPVPTTVNVFEICGNR